MAVTAWAGGQSNTLQAPALVISGTPGAATLNSAYTFTPTVTGGSGTKSFTYSGALPTGLSFSTSTGTISGTPTVAATFAGISITVSDTGGSTPATLGPFSIVVSASVAMRTPPPIFTAKTIYPVALTYDLNAVTFDTDYNAANYRHTGTNYYVSTTGDDTTGTGASGSPWRTLQKAHDTAAAGSVVNVAAGLYPPVVVTKSISFIATVDDTVYVGDFLTSGQVTLGALSSGRHTATLSSGYVYGFIDLGQLDPARLGRQYPKVAVSVPDLTAFAARVGYTAVGGQAAVLRGSGATPSTIGAANQRDLTGKIGTEILAWSDTAVTPLTVGIGGTGTITTGVTFYSRGIHYVGGPQRQVLGQDTTFVCERGGLLGTSDQIILIGDPTNGTTTARRTTLILKDSAAIGAAIGGFDVIDYVNGQSRGTHIGSVIGQGGSQGATGDQASTNHGGSLGVLHVNNHYFDVKQMIGDLGIGLSGIWGNKFEFTTFAPDTVMAAFDTAVEYHTAGSSYVGAVLPNSSMTISATCAVITYDNSLATPANKVITAGGILLDRTGTTDPTGDAILSQIIVDPQYLFQDANGTVPVTASGQSVARIQDAAFPGQYYLTTLGLTGTLTYFDDGGGIRRLAAARTNSTSGDTIMLTLNGRTETFGMADVVVGMKSSATQAILFGAGPATTAHRFAAMFNSGNFPTESSYATGTTLYKIDNGAAQTTKTNLKAAALNGVSHVLSVENIDLNASMWSRLRLFNALSGFQYTGDFYGMIIARKGTTGALNSYKATIAAAAGVTLP